MRIIKGVLWVLLLTVVLLGVPRLSGVVADLFDYQVIDPDGAYAWISIHHIVQALIFLLMILVINKIKPMDFGFGWGNKEVGKKSLSKFALYFAIYAVFAYLTMILTNAFQQFPYPLNSLNIIGQLGFQVLLSGPSEELIFRAFAITMLALVIQGGVLKGKLRWVNIIAAVIFGLAHVGISFSPLAFRYDLSQVIYSIVLGLIYGNVYLKTKSMYYPMLMHSYTNVIMVTGQIILSFIL